MSADKAHSVNPEKIMEGDLIRAQNADTVAVDKLTVEAFLRAVEAHGQEGCHHLIDQGYPPKVVYDRAKRAATKGCYEYGVSLPYGWLTSEGRAFLAEHSDGRDDAQEG